jgi:hypothetical protein
MTAELPDFATNSGPDGLRVADAVNRLFHLLRRNALRPPPLAIATAYINPGGFALLADELERAPRVRLLLGAEPDQATVRSLTPPPAADFDERLTRALQTHDEWIKLERDTMGFEAEATRSAHRMVEWLRSAAPDGLARVEVRRYNQGFLHGKAYIVEGDMPAALAGSSNMTHSGLGVNAELNLGTGGGTAPASKVLDWFNHHWDQSEAYDLAGLYADLWRPHTPWEIFLRMLWELYGPHLEEERAPAKTFSGLTRFQSDGVTRMRRLLGELGGVLVADDVGLGKTFLAAELIHEANEVLRQRVLVISPAALRESMWEPFLKAYGFSRRTDVLSYEDVRNRMDPDHPRHSEFQDEVKDYAMIVLDEAHNLRNAGAARSQAIDQVILGGAHPKKVVLLTATPVNNSLTDLETLIRYFVRDDARFAGVGIPSIRQYIRRAQSIDPENLTPEHLFDLMDQVAVRRTRRFIKEQYPGEEITLPGGERIVIRFPAPEVRRIDYEPGASGLELIDAMVEALQPPEQVGCLVTPGRLRLARYTPSAYLLNGGLEYYQVVNAGLLRSALLKRLESSSQALRRTLGRLVKTHQGFLSALKDGWVLQGEALTEWTASDSDALDQFVEDLDGPDGAQPASLFDLDRLAADVQSDLDLLRSLSAKADATIAAGDPKAERLLSELADIAESARRPHPGGLSAGDRR